MSLRGRRLLIATLVLTASGVGGRVTGGISAVPDRIHLGTIPVGQMIDARLTLLSQSASPFHILEFDSTSRDLEIERIGEASAGTCSFRVIQTATRRGHHSCSVKIVVSRETTNMGDVVVTVDVPVAYHGI